MKRYDIPGEYNMSILWWKHSDISIDLLSEHLLPPDSRVEIDAKIAAGYFSSGRQITEADLIKTVGRTWEETEH